MLGIRIGDKLRVDEVKAGRWKVRGTQIGKVIAEYQHYYSLQSKNYRFSVSKSALIDRTIQVKKIRTRAI